MTDAATPAELDVPRFASDREAAEYFRREGIRLFALAEAQDFQGIEETCLQLQIRARAILQRERIGSTP